MQPWESSAFSVSDWMPFSIVHWSRFLLLQQWPSVHQNPVSFQCRAWNCTFSGTSLQVSLPSFMTGWRFPLSCPHSPWTLKEEAMFAQGGTDRIDFSLSTVHWHERLRNSLWRGIFRRAVDHKTTQLVFFLSNGLENPLVCPCLGLVLLRYRSRLVWQYE